MLLAWGPDQGDAGLDTKDKRYRTPLWLTAMNGHDTVGTALLAWGGVNPNTEDENHQVLRWPVANNVLEAVDRRLLARESTDLEPEDGYTCRRTPLLCAVANGHKVVVFVLLKREGIDLNSIGSDRKKLISWPADNGHQKFVGLLLGWDGVGG